MIFFDILISLIQQIWHTLDDASIYILFGIFFSGVIQMFVNQDKIVKYLGESKFKSVLLAALFGVPLPLCSCGVIPTAMSLRKNGASKGATLSFLISTPETGLDSMAISYALITVFRPITAFLTAIVAGVGVNIFDKTTDNSFDKNNSSPILGKRAIVDVQTILIALVTFAVLFKIRKIPEPIVILLAGLAGLILFHG